MNNSAGALSWRYCPSHGAYVGLVCPLCARPADLGAAPQLSPLMLPAPNASSCSAPICAGFDLADAANELAGELLERAREAAA